MNYSEALTTISTKNMLRAHSLTHHFHIAEDLILKNLGELVPQEKLESWVIGLYQQQPEVTFYIHIPWCIEKCSFCYYRISDAVPRTEMNAYINLLEKHLMITSDLFQLQKKKVSSIYFGGGTPSILPPSLLEKSLGAFCRNFRDKNTEVTVEVSVDTLSEEKIRVISHYTNRLSLGVQSFNDRLLKNLRRTHSGARASKAITRLLRDFDHLNIDLIYGMRDQSLTDWIEDIRHAALLDIPSVTIYQLEIRSNLIEGTNFAKHPASYPSHEETAFMYLTAREILLESGYREALVGWFLLRSDHDVLVYRKRWEQGVPCIAFGPGTHNYGNNHFYYNNTNLQAYATSINNHTLPFGNSYSYPSSTIFLWYIVARWRSNKPVNIFQIQKAYPENQVKSFVAWATTEMDSKYFIFEKGSLRLSTIGNSVIDQIIVCLIQQYA